MRIVSALPLRLLLAAAAVVVLVLAIGRIGAVDGCAGARKDTLRMGRALAAHRTVTVPGGEQGVVRRLLADCRGGDELAEGSAALAAGGRTASAERLAREAIRREGDNFLAWDALALAVRGTDRAEARRAVARAQRLNPRGRVVAVP